MGLYCTTSPCTSSNLIIGDYFGKFTEDAAAIDPVYFAYRRVCRFNFFTGLVGGAELGPLSNRPAFASIGRGHNQRRVLEHFADTGGAIPFDHLEVGLGAEDLAVYPSFADRVSYGQLDVDAKLTRRWPQGSHVPRMQPPRQSTSRRPRRRKGD